MDDLLKDLMDACNIVQASLLPDSGPDFAQLGPDAATALLGKKMCCDGGVRVFKDGDEFVFECLVCGKKV